MPPRIHVFAIALENYQDPAIKAVTYAENDAKKFVAAWQQLGIDPADCVLLLSNQATLSTLTSRLRKFASNVGPDDRIVFFYVGHGLAGGGQSRMTAHDTQPDDLQNTSIPLRDILTELRRPTCSQVLLFFDVCHGGFPTIGGGVPTHSEFTGDELRDFCQRAKSGAESAVAFASCQANEISYSSNSFKQGIWTHCVIQALHGHAKDALEKGRLLTAASLQKYLREEVPRLLRVTITGTNSQTPHVWGETANDVIVANLSDLLNQRQLATSDPINFVKDSSLAGEIQGRVRELRGYKKPKTPLATHSPWERSFIEQAGEAEVGEQATEIIDQIRDSFRYKRKDLSFSNEGASASIKGPDFDVNVSLTQDLHDANKYVLKTEVASFRNPQVIEAPHFLEIFNRYCNKVVIDLESSLDLPSQIDEIEAVDALADNLEYDPDCKEFTLRVPDSGIVIHATAKRIIFSLDTYGDLKLLLDSTHKAISRLAGTSITLGLPNNSTP